MTIIGICCSLYGIITCAKAIKKLNWGGDYDILEIRLIADERIRSRQNKNHSKFADPSDLNRNKIEVSRINKKNLE